MTDLSTASLQELTTEIGTRCNASLIVMDMPMKVGKATEPKWTFSGGLMAAWGLAQAADLAIRRTLSTESDDEDED